MTKGQVNHECRHLHRQKAATDRGGSPGGHRPAPELVAGANPVHTGDVSRSGGLQILVWQEVRLGVAVPGQNAGISTMLN